MLLKSEGKFN